ncbi:MAG: phosphatase PAP2 family protein [Bacteroidia bacterium]
MIPGKENRTYLLVTGLGLLGFALLTLAMGYEESFLWMNSFHKPWLDAVMPHGTHLGQGIILTGLIVWLTGRKDPAWALTCLVSMLLLVPLVSLLKTQFFEAWDRPSKVFQDLDIHYVALQQLSKNSFPSGHSAAAVTSLFFASALFNKHKVLVAWLLAVCAILAGYSRVYIGVHFPGDVAAGMLLGMAVALFSLLILYPFFRSRKLDSSPGKMVSRLGLLVAVAGLIMLANTFYIKPLQTWDTQLLLYINSSHSPFLDKIMSTLSARLPWLWVPPVLIGGAWWKGGWRLALHVTIGLLLAILLADRVSAGLLKPWIGRIRPCKPEAGLLEQLHLIGGCGGMYGFVSSHAANFFAIAMMAALSFSTRWITILAMLLAAAVGYSRIYLGVHYPGDVLGGLGTFVRLSCMVGRKHTG